MSIVKIKDIGTVITGKTPATKRPEYFHGDVLFITPSDITDGGYIDSTERTISQGGLSSIKNNSIDGISILVGCIGSDMGNVAWTDKKCATNQQINSITQIKSEYNPLYIYYFLSLKKDFLRMIAGTTTTPLLPKSTFEEIDLELPCSNIQNKVVEIMQCIDTKIRANRKSIYEFESLAKTIYDYWFLQFDFPNKEGKPYKSSGGTMVWNENLKMEIPEGWEVVNFMDVADWESNSQPPKSEFIYQEKEGYIRFIQNRDYDSSEHKTYIPWTKGLNTVTRFDILMDKYGDAGATRYGIEGTYNVALGKIVPHDPMMQEYLRLFLSSDHIYHFLHNSCMASTRASLGETSLSLLNVPVPPKKLLIEFQSLAHKIREEILILKDENEELISLRDFLLPLLMNGQVEVA